MLSTISGAIVLCLNDQLDPLMLANQVASACNAAGLAIRVGVTQGNVHKLRDADGLDNYVGSVINDAARLAFSSKNTGICVKQEGLALNVAEYPWLNPEPECHAGKRTEVVLAYSSRSPMQDTSNVVERAPQGHNRILLSYDLERFSANASHHLAKRFTIVAEHIRQRQPRLGSARFSPGGDGGVLVLPGGGPELQRRSQLLAEELNFLLAEVGHELARNLQVIPRSALHYGRVLTYRNAAGILRPTGRALLEADRLPYKAGEVVLSRAFLGAKQANQEERDYAGYREIVPGEITSLTDRFVRRHDGARVLTLDEFQAMTVHLARKCSVLKHISLNPVHNGMDQSRTEFQRVVLRRAGEDMSYLYVTNVKQADKVKLGRIQALIARCQTRRTVVLAHFETRAPRLFNYMLFGADRAEIALLVFSNEHSLGAILVDDELSVRTLEQSFDRMLDVSVRLVGAEMLRRLTLSPSEGS